MVPMVAMVPMVPPIGHGDDIEFEDVSSLWSWSCSMDSTLNLRTSNCEGPMKIANRVKFTLPYAM